jgi:enoyl-CoA hydratase/carnithine racemase
MSWISSQPWRSAPAAQFLRHTVIKALADMFEARRRPDCRAIVLAAQGKSFCAGANFGDGTALAPDGSIPGRSGDSATEHLYLEAVRLFRTRKPVIGAIHGAAVGGGLGLALVPDFRVTCAEARFSANFTKLGFHPGFGLTVTLPELIGKSNASLMFYTSRRVKGDEAHRMGLADVLVPLEQAADAAHALAREIDTRAPLGVVATRATLRQGLADRVVDATKNELTEQTRLRRTQDFKEGIQATAERREPQFRGA